MPATQETMLAGKILRTSALAARPMTVAAASRAASGVASRSGAFALARAAPAAVARSWTGFPAQSRQMATVGSEGTDSDFTRKVKEPVAEAGDRNIQAEIKEVIPRPPPPTVGLITLQTQRAEKRPPLPLYLSSPNPSICSDVFLILRFPRLSVNVRLAEPTQPLTAKPLFFPAMLPRLQFALV